MKKLLTFILILIIHSLPTFASSPNGKGLICKCVDIKKCPTKDFLFWNSYVSPNGTPSELGILFEKNYVIPFYIVNINDQIVSIEEPKEYGGKYKFRTTKDHIKWKSNDGDNYLIKRKSLMFIENIYVNKEKLQFFRKCNVYNKVKFLNKLEDLVIWYQLEHNKLLKDNKI